MAPHHLAPLAIAAFFVPAAQAQFGFISQSRVVSAQAQSSANASTDSEGPVSRSGPALGAAWNTLNNALASTSVPRASAGASSIQVSSFTPIAIQAQGSTSSTAIISASATTGSVQTRGESSCIFFFTLPANQRLEVVASQSGTGVVRISRTSNNDTLFAGSGVTVLAFPTAQELRFEGSALAAIASTIVPTNAGSGGGYSVTLTNLDAPVVPSCDPIDFNQNSLFPEDQDLIDFLSVLAGGPCSPGNTCSDIDFNNDGLFPSDDDLIAFLRVLAGGSCN